MDKRANSQKPTNDVFVDRISTIYYRYGNQEYKSKNVVIYVTYTNVPFFYDDKLVKFYMRYEGTNYELKKNVLSQFDKKTNKGFFVLETMNFKNLKYKAKVGEKVESTNGGSQIENS